VREPLAAVPEIGLMIAEDTELVAYGMIVVPLKTNQPDTVTLELSVSSKPSVVVVVSRMTVVRDPVANVAVIGSTDDA